MPTAVPPPEPPAITATADGGVRGTRQFTRNEHGIAEYMPSVNALMVTNTETPKDGNGYRSWAMTYDTHGQNGKQAAHDYLNTKALPAKGAKEFSCTSLFNNESRSVTVKHVPHVDAMPQATRDANPAYQGLSQGNGEPYLYTAKGKIEYARGEAGVAKLLDQAKQQCQLAGPLPKFTP